MKRTQESLEEKLYDQFPWTKPIVPDIEPEEGFAEPVPLELTVGRCSLLVKMFTEVELFYKTNNRPINVAIYEIRDSFGILAIDLIAADPEVYRIIRKYEQESQTVCYKCGKPGELVFSNGIYAVVCKDCK